MTPSATPVVVDDEVYFGTATFTGFYKLSRDGRLLWSYRNHGLAWLPVSPPKGTGTIQDTLRMAAQPGGIFASALVVKDLVVFGDTLGCVTARDRENGAPVEVLPRPGAVDPRCGYPDLALRPAPPPIETKWTRDS